MSNPIRSLLVEDDLDLAGNLLDYLELESILCDHASNGMAALTMLEQQDYQVVILDINLPRLSGLGVCQTLRANGNDTPVIMLTARDQLSDKVEGFEQGADDYLVKPFALEELVVRVRALAKRRSGQVQQLQAGPLKYDLTNRQVTCNDQPLKLSPTGLILLEQLMRAVPNRVTREALIQAVWGEDCPDSNALKVHLHHLRKALAAHSRHIYIQSQPQAGFRLLFGEDVP